MKCSMKYIKYLRKQNVIAFVIEVEQYCIELASSDSAVILLKSSVRFIIYLLYI